MRELRRLLLDSWLFVSSTRSGDHNPRFPNRHYSETGLGGFVRHIRVAVGSVNTLLLQHDLSQSVEPALFSCQFPAKG